MPRGDELRQRCEDFYAACNRGDIDEMKKHLADDAVHYFPEGSSLGTLRGSDSIASTWNRAVREQGSRWTLDNVLVDTARREAALEWTHYKTKYGGHIRGAEFYIFDNDDRIIELRPYYAAPAPDQSTRYELAEFDYGKRGFSTTPPDAG